MKLLRGARVYFWWLVWIAFPFHKTRRELVGAILRSPYQHRHIPFYEYEL